MTPCDAAIVVVVDADEVGAVGDDEVDVFFEATDVFELEKRYADEFAELAVCECGFAAVFVDIFPPVVVVCLAGAADLECVSEG